METNWNCQRLIRLIAASVVMSSAAQHAPADDALKLRVDRLAQPYLDADVVAGMTVGVLRNGESTIVGYGRRGDSDAHRPDGETVYEIGSMSKVFTGVLLGDAVVRGHVRLNQPT